MITFVLVLEKSHFLLKNIRDLIIYSFMCTKVNIIDFLLMLYIIRMERKRYLQQSMGFSIV